jgi:hypothetical protein
MVGHIRGMPASHTCLLVSRLSGRGKHAQRDQSPSPRFVDSGMGDVVPSANRGNSSISPRSPMWTAC